MKPRHFLLALLLMPSLLWAVNPGRGPDPDTRSPKDDDTCPKSSSSNGSFKYALRWGGIAMSEELSEGAFYIWESQPSPAMFSASVLHYRHPAAIRLFRYFNDGGGCHAIMQGVDSIPIQFDIPYGQSVGLPTGRRIASSQRLLQLDYAGQPVASSPDIFRILETNGSFVDVDVHSKAAVRHHSATGRDTDFSALPAAIAIRLIYKDGNLRQVHSASGLADIVSRGVLGFELRLYEAGAEGSFNAASGLYEASGAPYRTVFIENPDSTGKHFNSIRVTETWGSMVKVDTFTYDVVLDDWTLVQGAKAGGALTRRESKTRILGPGSNQFTYHITLTDGDGKVISVRDETRQKFSWGYEKVSEVLEPDTLNLLTTWDYNTAAPGIGKVNHVIHADGSWESYTYDSSNRVLTFSRPWKDSTYSATATTQRRITSYDYTSLDASDIVKTNDDRPRTETESVIPSDGASSLVVGRTFHVYKVNASGQAVVIKERAVAASALYGDVANLRTTTVYYTADSSKAGYDVVMAGNIAYEDKPDGTRTSYSYSQDLSSPDAAFTTSTVNATVASPDGVEGLSTRSVASYNLQGQLKRTQSYVYSGAAWCLTRDQVESWSVDGFTTGRTLDGRQVYGATYDGGRMSSETDETGISTVFTYDDLGRIQTATKNGVAAASPYDAQADIITTYIRSIGGLTCGCDGEVTATVSSGTLSQTTTVRKDQVGRASYEKDAAGLETNYSYTLGGRQVTRYNPDGGTVVTVKMRDGRVLSEGGTGVDARSFDYGVNDDGSQWTQVSQGTRKTKETMDFLGRSYSSVVPAYDGGSIVTSNAYNSEGHLSKTMLNYYASGSNTAVKIRADMLYFYDLMGNPSRSGLDVDGDGVLTLASSDRITDTSNAYQKIDSAYWLVQKVLIYPTLNSAVAVKASETRQRVSGFSGTLAQETISLDVDANVTQDKTEIDASTKFVTQTTSRADSDTAAVRITRNGLLVRESTNTVSDPIVFTYDPLGRLVSAQDPRHTKSSGRVYSPVTGQLTTVTDAVGNPTSFAYYPTGVAGAGRLSLVTDALGKTKRMAYDLHGRVIYQWGTSAYPQALGYNAYGNLETSTTWRDTGLANLNGESWPNLTGGDTTTWNYDAPSGLLTGKRYADGNGPDYTYNKANRLETRTWSRSVSGTRVRSTYDYDPLTGEMTSVSYTDGTHSVVFGYDRLGRQDSVTDASGARSFAYDPLKLRLSTETLPSSYFGARLITYDYQASGTGLVLGRYGGYRLGVDATPAQDFSVSYGYDAQGRLSTVTSGSGAFSYAYKAKSDLLETVTGPVLKASYTYEPDRDTLTQVENLVGGVAISRFGYGVDVVGRRSSRTEAGSAFGTSSYERFDYNDRNEVTGSLSYTGTNPANYLSDAGIPSLGRSYQYDPIGNRTSSTEGVGTARVYTPNSLNQYSGLTNPAAVPSYDLDGNQTATGAGWYYDWDAENRLVSARNYASSPISGSIKVDYVYDYQSRRIRRTLSSYSGSAWSVTDDRKFIYEGWNLVAEFNAAATSRLQAYTWGLDLSRSLNGAGGAGGLLSVSTYSSSAAHFFATYDANGNVSEYINAAGATEAHFVYDAFGQLVSSSGSNLSRFLIRFSTKCIDEQVGLYYYGLRYYSPSTGRWVNRDPIGEKGGVNRYSFVLNKSVNIVDVLGLKGLDSPSATLTQAILQGNIGAIEDILALEEVGGIMLTEQQIAAAKAAIIAIAAEKVRKDQQSECEKIHAAYKSLNCRGCSNGCVDRVTATANATCLSAEVAGRSLYLEKRCDYILAGSIARGSAIAEAGHRNELANKRTALGTCLAKAKAP